MWNKTKSITSEQHQCNIYLNLIPFLKRRRIVVENLSVITTV